MNIDLGMANSLFVETGNNFQPLLLIGVCVQLLGTDLGPISMLLDIPQVCSMGNRTSHEPMSPTMPIQVDQTRVDLLALESCSVHCIRSNSR